MARDEKKSAVAVTQAASQGGVAPPPLTPRPGARRGGLPSDKRSFRPTLLAGVGGWVAGGSAAALSVLGLASARPRHLLCLLVGLRACLGRRGVSFRPGGFWNQRLNERREQEKHSFCGRELERRSPMEHISHDTYFSRFLSFTFTPPSFSLPF